MIGIEAGTLDVLVNFCYSGEVNIDDNNVQDILAGACLLQLDEVKHIISLEGFHHLLVEQVTELISSDVLVVRSEEQVFDAVIKWINFDLTTRKSLLSQLLQHVRLPLCQPKFLVDVVSKNALVMADAACRNLVDAAKNYQLRQMSTPVRPNMQDPRTRPRTRYAIW